MIVGLFLNDKYLNNDFEYLVTTDDYADKWSNKKETFYFGFNIYGKLDKIDTKNKNVYIICDDYKKISKNHH